MAANKPLLTIATVVRNDLDGLQRTINSIQKFKDFDFEFIVVDGESSDGTSEFIRSSYGIFDHYIIERDSGIYNAMNKAVRISTGKYILFMNAGDELYKNFDIAEVESIARASSPDFIYGDRIFIEEDGSAKYQKAGDLSESLVKECVYHQSVFTRTELLLERPYREDFRFAADYEYIVHAVSENYKFEYSPQPFSRFFAGGRSRQYHFLVWLEIAKILYEQEVNWRKMVDHPAIFHLVDRFLPYHFNKSLEAVDAKTGPYRLKVKATAEGGVNIVPPERRSPLGRLVNSINDLLESEKLGLDVERPSGGRVPKVSVVTINFNDRAGLRRTIESVLAQDYSNLEYIVIDGASTDGSTDLLTHYGEQIQQVVSEPDGGIYDAMNKGLDRARGEFVIYMNAGDEFHSPESVSLVMENADPESDVIYGSRVYVSAGGDRVLQAANPIETVTQRMPYCHQAAFVRRALLEKYPFDLTYKFAADYNQVVQLYKSGANFQVVEHTVCNFYAGGSSESGLRPYLEVMKIQLDNFPKSELKDSHYISAFMNNAETLFKKFREE